MRYKEHEFSYFQRTMNENMAHELYKEKYGACDPMNNITVVGDDDNDTYKNFLREAMTNLVLEEAQRLGEAAVNLCAVTDLCKGNLGVPRILMPVIEDKQVDLFIDLLSKGLLTTDPKQLKSFGYDVSKKGHPVSDHSVIISQQFLTSGDKKKDKVKISTKSIDIQKLSATQNEINKDKSEGMYAVSNNPDVKWRPWTAAVIVSKDNYIVDGHHRWAATLMYHLEHKNDSDYKQVKMEGTTIDLDIRTLLAVANAFTDSIGNKRKPFE